MIREYAVAEEMAGEKIRAVRAKLKLTQADLTKLVNVSVKTIEK